MGIELITVTIYLVLIFSIAFLSRPKNKDPNEIFLAGNSLSKTESIFSIIATEVSALTFIGIPAFSFGMDYRFIFVYVGAIFGRYIIARYYIPKYYKQGLTIFSIAFGKHRSQTRATSTIYLVSKSLAVGVRLYSGSILVSQFFNLPIITAITLLTGLTYAYTQIGGLKTVVRTDIIQTGIFILGGLSAHFLIPDISNRSWSELINIGFINHKIFSFELSYIPIVLTGVLGGALFDIATHGIDQDFAQRLLANKSKTGAQASIFLSSFFSIFVGLLFLSIGTLLYGYHQNVPYTGKVDYVFSGFIVQHYPPVLRGLMLSGVLAATMSTLDSTINAINSCLYSDLNLRTNTKFSGLLASMVLLFIAIVSTKSTGILTVGLKVASWSAGFLLTVVSMALFKKYYISTISMTVIYSINLVVIYLSGRFFELTWHWNTYTGSAITLVLAFSLNFFKKPRSA